MRGVGRGVLNAPVDWRWRASKRSCSSLGSRGGAGAVKSENGLRGFGLVDVKSLVGGDKRRISELVRARMDDVRVVRVLCVRFRKREVVMFVRWVMVVVALLTTV